MSDETVIDPASIDALAAERVPPKPRRPAGRPKGSFNKSLVTERRIKQHYAARSFLNKVIRGGKIKSAEKTAGKTRVWSYPTLPERLKAAELQLRDAATVAAIQAAEAGTPLGQTLDALDAAQIQNLITALRAERFKSQPRPIAVDATFTTVTPIREGNPPLALIHKEPKND